jgi:hypothetical protein
MEGHIDAQVRKTVHLLWDAELLWGVRHLRDAVRMLPDGAARQSNGCAEMVRMLRVLESELERRQVGPSQRTRVGGSKSKRRPDAGGVKP